MGEALNEAINEAIDEVLEMLYIDEVMFYWTLNLSARTRFDLNLE